MSGYTRDIALKILGAIDLFEDENERIIACSIANMALVSPIVDDEYSIYDQAVEEFGDRCKVNYVAQKVVSFVR